MTPTSDNILISPIDKKVSAGLIVPPQYARKNKEFLSGKVISIGPKVSLVQTGDEIAYAKDTEIEIQYKGQKLVFIKPKHILGVV